MGKKLGESDSPGHKNSSDRHFFFIFYLANRLAVQTQSGWDGKKTDDELGDEILAGQIKLESFQSGL